MIFAFACSLVLFSCKQNAEQKDDNESSTPHLEQKEEGDNTSIEVSKDGINVETQNGDNKTSVTISKDSAGLNVEKPPK